MVMHGNESILKYRSWQREEVFQKPLTGPRDYRAPVVSFGIWGWIMTGYTKLFASILDSTIWRESEVENNSIFLVTR